MTASVTARVIGCSPTWRACSRAKCAMWIWPGASAAAAAEIAERARQSLANQTVGTGAGQLRVTASFGVAVLAGEANALLAAADAALYAAKREGRNRVRIAA